MVDLATKEPSIWVVDSGMAGDTNNRLAVAEALSPNNHKSVDMSQLLFKDITDWPDIFITGEQNGDQYSRAAKLYSEGKTFVVGMQSPDRDSNMFEANHGKQFADYRTDYQILFSHHDSSEQLPHLKHMGGAPKRGLYDYATTRITPEKLKEVERDIPEKIASVIQNKPVFTVAMGGLVDAQAAFNHDAACYYPDENQVIRDNVRKMVQQVAKAAKALNGSVLVTTSRRTGAAAQKIIEEELRDVPHYAYDWEKSNGQDNPYQQMLAVADRVVVSGDSISMTMDALATGKPVSTYVPSLEPNNEQPLPLSDALEKCKFFKPAVNKYMRILAEKNHIQPMSALSKQEVDAPEPITSAKQMASDVMEAYQQFKAKSRDMSC